MYAEAAKSEPAAAHFCLACVVCAPVHQHTLCRLKVFLPCLLQMDQRPLAAAEGKMLQARKHQPLFFGVFHHSITVQLTPSGRLSSTDTV